MGKPHLTSTKFSELNLHDSLQESLEDNGYVYCTSIQEKTLPKLLEGKDITGQAQTGTGKTAAFLLATLNHLMTVPVSEEKKGPFALVMAPTRELALQIFDDAKMLGAYTGLKYALLYGGAGYGPQERALSDNADVVIGTVGRILDFYKQKKLNLSEIEILVLDEADRMFDLGFIDDVRYLIRKMPQAAERRNMLFSATFSQRVLELAYEHMNDPEMVQIEPEQVTAERIEQSLYHVSSDEKMRLLFGLLEKEKPARSIIFVNTRHVADEIFRTLRANDYKAAMLSGDVRQNRRESLLEDFRQGKLNVMVATDVAARGLHIPDVTHVFNYDLPQDAEDYVHRIGRTARAGEEGKAISLACEEYVYSLPDIEEYIKAEIPVSVIEEGMLPEINAPRPRNQRGNRNRNSNNQNSNRNQRNRNQDNRNQGNRHQGNSQNRGNNRNHDNQQNQSDNENSLQKESAAQEEGRQQDNRRNQSNRNNQRNHEQEKRLEADSPKSHQSTADENRSNQQSSNQTDRSVNQQSQQDNAAHESNSTRKRRQPTRQRRNNNERNEANEKRPANRGRKGKPQVESTNESEGEVRKSRRGRRGANTPEESVVGNEQSTRNRNRRRTSTPNNRNEEKKD